MTTYPSPSGQASTSRMRPDTSDHDQPLAPAARILDGMHDVALIDSNSEHAADRRRLLCKPWPQINVAPVTFLLIALATGCAPRQIVPDVPPPAAAQVRPPDWFHQQLAAARAARQAHQPKTDTAGAQQAYDEVLRTACTRATLAGPGKYPVRCDTVLHPRSGQFTTDPCSGHVDDPTLNTECSD